ncbi:RpoE-regulated lipoprotein [Affinibrenneria salicis]|uniref:RpoE-regulated lipoprotein n=1 Tax=Affinibrenneria salicis TaxID=2590031 RepID=A0A5J5G997_9GAMM|nr:RpoE-regulated lipoprotein [Affinibrenneria salicis]KAA9002527.1 RpoE-regulated lipoprotein [Affinibrenneria salicis]KAA9003185.1 RpoE-regulated lipoprotein [Affinibrenneria salicis]
MRFRPLLLGLPLVLSGCGTMSNFSWSSLSPFNWFGGAITVQDSGVGDINAGTPLSEPVLNKALNEDYRLRSGMGTQNGQLVAFYEALDGDSVRLVISGQPKGAVTRVDVSDAAIASQWGVKVGDAFSSLYGKAFGSCWLGQGEDARRVECAAPGSAHVSYIYGGEWRGPEGLMPSDDVLRDWKVVKIVWRAQARN